MTKEQHNHQIVYDEVTDNIHELGLDYIYILKQNMNIKSEDLIDGIEFNFNWCGKDNIVCERQHISVTNVKACKMHIVGFSYWGDANEIFQIVYENGEIEYINISFIDWAHKAERYGAISSLKDNINTARQIISSGAKIHLIFFHHSVLSINNRRKEIKEIILPDNFLIHIFAITLEM